MVALATAAITGASAWVLLMGADIADLAFGILLRSWIGGGREQARPGEQVSGRRGYRRNSCRQRPSLPPSQRVLETLNSSIPSIPANTLRS
jgi:hypothetical protein